MTKKNKSVNAATKATTAKKTKNEPVSKVTKPRGRGRPRKSSVTQEKGAKGKKTDKQENSNKTIKDSGLNKAVKSTRKLKTESLVETKVREIVKKTKAKSDSQYGKKESATFSIDDVRSIIENRKKDLKKSKAKETKKTKATPLKTDKKISASKKKAIKIKKIQTASIDDILGFGQVLGSSRPIRDESKVPAQWKSYYNDLMSLRNSLKGALGQRSNETLGSSARESSGELSINSSDSGTESFDRDVALSMVASEQDALEEIEDAIDRIFDGTFGICQETQKPIKKARLKVVPFTRFSLEGQVLHENRKRKENDNGGGIFATIADSTMGEDN